MKKVLARVVVGIFLGTVLWGGKSFAASEYDQGRKIYAEKCVICHGKRGDGNGPGAVAFSPRPANFTEPTFWGNNVEKKIADTIKNGHGPMPAFDLTPDQIKAVTDYLSHAFKPKK